MEKRKQLIDEVEKYYTSKIREYGATSQGVDWNGAESQELRFDQFTRLLRGTESFSLLDYGSGYGAILQYFKPFYEGMKYSGYDISEDMISKALEVNSEISDCEFFSNLEEGRTWDYVVASGLFNVRLNSEVKDWEDYIIETIHKFDALCEKGFAFNILTSYSDLDKQKDYLHYGNPSFYFDYCKRHFSRNVAVLHDYDLYEFTILVKK